MIYLQNLSQNRLIENNLAQYFLIPHRYLLAIMLILGATLMVLLDRTPEMVVNPHQFYTMTNATNQSCNLPVLKEYTIHSSGSPLGWNVGTQKLLLYLQIFCYMLSYVPSGYLSDTFGGKPVFSVAVLGNSICSFFYHLILQGRNTSKIALFTAKIINSLCRGAVIPSIHSLLAQWTTKFERNTISFLIYGFIYVTISLSVSLNLALMRIIEYFYIFYLYGCLGIIWCVLWYFLCFSSPETHYFISTKERTYLVEELEGDLSKTKNKKVPWLQILSSKPLWALIAMQLAYNWYLYTKPLVIQRYMREILRVNLISEVISVWWNLLGWLICALFGCFCDWCANEEFISLTKIRRWSFIFGAVGTALFHLLTLFARCKRFQAILYFVVSLSFNGICFCVINVNALDLSPNFAGIVIGIVKAVSTLGGFACYGVVTNIISIEDSYITWDAFFYIYAFGFVLSSVLYYFMGSGEIQVWNYVGNEK